MIAHALSLAGPRNHARRLRYWSDPGAPRTLPKRIKPLEPENSGMGDFWAIDGRGGSTIQGVSVRPDLLVCSTEQTVLPSMFAQLFPRARPLRTTAATLLQPSRGNPRE